MPEKNVIETEEMNEEETNSVSEAFTQEEKENFSENIEKPQKFVERLREKELISPIRLIVIGSTTATTAFVSSKLTNYMNATIMVAMIAVFAGFITEFYAHFYSLTTKGLKKIVPSNGKLKSRQKELTKNLQKTSKNKKDFKKSSKIVGFLEQYSISVFILLIAALTIGTMATINHFTEKPVVNQITEVTQQSIEKMSEDEKKAIIDQATDDAKSDLNSILHYLETSGSTNSEDIKSLTSKLNGYKTLIDSIEKDRSDSDTTLKDLQEENLSKDEKITELEESLKNLSSEFEDLKKDYESNKNSESVTSTTESTTSPTSSPTTSSEPPHSSVQVQSEQPSLSDNE